MVEIVVANGVVKDGDRFGWRGRGAKMDAVSTRIRRDGLSAEGEAGQAVLVTAMADQARHRLQL